jgi:hypothetical protein
VVASKGPPSRAEVDSRVASPPPPPPSPVRRRKGIGCLVIAVVCVLDIFVMTWAAIPWAVSFNYAAWAAEMWLDPFFALVLLGPLLAGLGVAIANAALDRPSSLTSWIAFTFGMLMFGVLGCGMIGVVLAFLIDWV